jgi:formylglycine-generating enzyme required for sulfatase activity
MGENPSHFNGDNQSVETVGWDDAQAFIKQLNQTIPHLKIRLPWEAEWEYACRAGRQTPFNFADGLALDKVNYRGTWEYNADEWGQDAKRETAEVKSYPCNDWGLYEMHGNVWEWCEDVWQEHLGHEAVRGPWQQSVPAPGTARVVRGGSWYNDGRSVRSAIRLGSTPDDRDDDLGFRLALGHSGSSQEGGTKA